MMRLSSLRERSANGSKRRLVMACADEQRR
jgi:hypothetical protein